MSSFKEFSSEDIKTDRDMLEQLVDILQNDISSSATRKSYQVWVTGGIGPGITSSLFQTIFDQDYTLQTANPILDITFGLAKTSPLVTGSNLLSIDVTTGKYYFASQSVQMREKIDIYNLFAKECLGDADSTFQVTTGSTTTDITEPMFISFKRIFARDRLKRETFAIKLLQTASAFNGMGWGSKIYTDVGSTSNIEQSFGGQVSTVVDSANVNYPVGLLYLDRGIAVLDTKKIFDQNTGISGSLKAMSTSGYNPTTSSFSSLLVSGCLDDICNHVCGTRFGGDPSTAITFQNQTYINSTLFFCRFTADEFNYSSNPTYTDSTGRLVVIDPGQEESQNSFTYVTSIGLYDAYNNLLGIAKTSRPILKDSSRDFSVKIRMDY